MKKRIPFFALFLAFGVYAQEKSVFDVARSGSLEEMKAIFKATPKAIDSVDQRSFSPLILASYRGNAEVAKFLIENVKDVNYQSSEGTALDALAFNYNKELVEMLLKKGANPNVVDARGNSPLTWAIRKKNAELIALLLERGADKNIKDAQGFTAFEIALQTKDQQIINILKTN